MRHLLLILFAISFIAGTAQQDFPGNNKIIPDLLFTRFSSKEGLPDNRIRSVFQDSKGFLWVGTMNGVGKYDGYNFRKYYNQDDAATISGNWAFAICEDSLHNIWIGTLNGLNRFDTRKERFTSYRHQPGNANSLFSNKITALQFDRFGKLWIGTVDGLAKLDPATGRFQQFKQYPFNTHISKIIASSGNYIWIATAGGIVRYNTENNSSRFYEIKVKPDPYGSYFWSLLEDRHHLYIATATQGLIRLTDEAGNGEYKAYYNLNSFANTRHQLAYTEVFDLCKSAAGDLWLATDEGLSRIENPGTGDARLYMYKNNPLNNQSLSHNTVYQVYIDKTDNLWCGTEMGLNKLNLQILPFRYFSFRDPVAEDQVRGIFTRDGENIWMGTARNACYSYNVSGNTTETFKLQPGSSAFNAHRSLYVDEHNVPWLGTLGGALQLNKKNPAASRREIDGSAVFAFLEDSKGNLWMGATDGLVQVKKDGSRKKYEHRANDPNSLPAPFVRSLYEDHNGRIWVGFETAGISYYDPATGSFTRVAVNESGEKLLGNLIYSIVESPRNVIWAGSESGLNKITLTEKAGKYSFRIRNYSEKEGLPDKSVNGILPEQGKFLWISSIKGLSRFDIGREQFEHYLPTLNFSFSSAFKFNEHQFLFGTSDGFLMFDPSAISRNTVLPDVAISDLRLFNQAIAIDSAFNGEIVLHQAIGETKEISLGYKNNVFTLSFVGLHFSDPSNNRYAYQMAGFDKDWIYTSANDRSVTYTNLDPGTYYFKVKAANSFGKWNEVPAVLKINIIPAPWNTWWAKLLYVLFFGAALLLVGKFIMRQSRQRHEIETERLLRLKDEALHQEQLSFFTNITHELQTPLTLINGSVERFQYKSNHGGSAGDKNYFLSLIHQQSSRLTYLVNQLLDFRKAEAGHLKNQYNNLQISSLLTGIANLFTPLCEQKQLRYKMEVTPDITGWTDKDKLEKIVFNLLSNAFKHSEREQEVVFSVTKADKDTVQIEVSNSGCTLSEEQLHQIFDKFFVVNNGEHDKYSHGIGLAFTRQLVQLLQGKLDVVNNDGWISFRVVLPLAVACSNDASTATPLVHTPSYLLRSITADTAVSQQRSAREINKHALVASFETQDKRAVLVVEDEAAIRYLLRDILSEHYIVYEAENGRQALELLKNTIPDLIISDIMMPEVDGLELCNRVKNTPDTCQIPFILLSARGTLEQKTEGYDAGADAYIPKPFDTVHLLVRVRRLLEYRQRLLELFKKDDLVSQIAEEDLADGDKQFLNNVVRIIEENMDNTELDAAFVEAQLSVSKMQLYRKLKALSDMAPSEFIKHVRLQRAGLLLQSTQLTVAEIFYKTGFNNQSYFFKEFKKRYQCSPGEYRAQNRISAG